MFTEMPTDNLFDIAQRVVEENTKAVDAVREDVLAQWGTELPADLTAGVMTCGIVLFLTIMQGVAKRKEGK